MRLVHQESFSTKDNSNPEAAEGIKVLGDPDDGLNIDIPSEINKSNYTNNRFITDSSPLPSLLSEGLDFTYNQPYNNANVTIEIRKPDEGDNLYALYRIYESSAGSRTIIWDGSTCAAYGRDSEGELEKQFNRECPIGDYKFKVTSTTADGRYYVSSSDDIKVKEDILFNYFTPTSGEPGDSVTIKGRGFAQLRNPNISNPDLAIAYFGGASNSAFIENDTTIVTSVPTSAETGTIRITNTAGGSETISITSSDSFTVNRSTEISTNEVNIIQPNAGDIVSGTIEIELEETGSYTSDSKSCANGLTYRLTATGDLAERKISGPFTWDLDTTEYEDGIYFLFAYCYAEDDELISTDEILMRIKNEIEPFEVDITNPSDDDTITYIPTFTNEYNDIVYPTVDLTVQTNQDAICKYSIADDFDFETQGHLFYYQENRDLDNEITPTQSHATAYGFPINNNTTYNVLVKCLSTISGELAQDQVSFTVGNSNPEELTIRILRPLDGETYTVTDGAFINNFLQATTSLTSECKYALNFPEFSFEEEGIIMNSLDGLPLNRDTQFENSITIIGELEDTYNLTVKCKAVDFDLEEESTVSFNVTEESRPTDYPPDTTLAPTCNLETDNASYEQGEEAEISYAFSILEGTKDGEFELVLLDEADDEIEEFIDRDDRDTDSTGNQEINWDIPNNLAAGDYTFKISGEATDSSDDSKKYTCEETVEITIEESDSLIDVDILDGNLDLSDEDDISEVLVTLNTEFEKLVVNLYKYEDGKVLLPAAKTLYHECAVNPERDCTVDPDDGEYLIEWDGSLGKGFIQPGTYIVSATGWTDRSDDDTRIRAIDGYLRVYGFNSSADCRFTDVSPSDPDIDAINWACENGIFKGSNNRLYPNEKLKRIEALATSNRMSRCRFLSTYNPSLDGPIFKDMVPYMNQNSTLWMFEELKKGTVECVTTIPTVQGYGDGNFRPINNVQFMEYAKIALISLQNGRLLKSPIYPNYNKEPWYEDIRLYLLDRGLPSLPADAQITRRDAINFLWNLKVAGIIPEDLDTPTAVSDTNNNSGGVLEL